MSEERRRCSPEQFETAWRQIIDSIRAENVVKPDASSKIDSQTVRDFHQIIAKLDKNEYGQSSSILDMCEGFISDWEASGQVSAAVQQLIALLRRPHVLGVLCATSDISARRFEPTLPVIPFEVDDDDGVAVKIVRLVKTRDSLGATIKRDPQGRVTIARIIAGGTAERSGCIQEGDRVLEVNGRNVGGLEPNEIAALLNQSADGIVTFKLVPTEVAPHSTYVASVHLRAQFDYSAERDDEHPCYDAALSFGKGDVLELVVSNDAHWWQARRLGWGAFADGEETRALLGSGVNGLELRVGLIPSELRQQEKSDAAPKPSESLSLFYEPVSRAWPRMLPPRPVVLIGPPGVGRNELKRRIMSLYPERFSTTVPHTSRPPRQHELPGADYHFVTRTQLQNMIARGEMLEFGEFRGNLYGTALSSVRDARIKATPLLTPHPLALQSLRTAEFTPVVVFVRPPRVDKFKETRDAHRDRCSRAPSVASTATGLSAVVPRAYTVEDCEQVVCAGRQLERQLAHLVDAVVENGELDVAVRQLCEIVDRIEREPAWVPSSWLERGRRASSKEQ